MNLDEINVCHNGTAQEFYQRLAFHRRAKRFELNFSITKKFLFWSNQKGKIFFTAGQFAWYLWSLTIPSAIHCREKDCRIKRSSDAASLSLELVRKGHVGVISGPGHKVYIDQ